MKTKELFNKLKIRQKYLLEEVTKGKTIYEDDVTEIINNLNQLYRGKYVSMNPIPSLAEENPLISEWWSLTNDTQENFTEVYRYLSSLKASEEVRKEKVTEIADIKHEEKQKEISFRMLSGERFEEIINDIIEKEHNLTMKLAIEFGFTYEEICQIVKREYDFSFQSQNIIKDEFSKLLEELFG